MVTGQDSGKIKVKYTILFTLSPTGSLLLYTQSSILFRQLSKDTQRLSCDVSEPCGRMCERFSQIINKISFDYTTVNFSYIHPSDISRQSIPSTLAALCAVIFWLSLVTQNVVSVFERTMPWRLTFQFVCVDGQV